MELDERGIGPDQRRYARLLSLLTNSSLALLVVLFMVYAGGVVDPHVPHEQLPEVWKLPAKELLDQVGLSPGWGWTAFLHRADLLTLVGIAALAFASVPCLIAIMPLYWAGQPRALAAICGLEVTVITLAASGLIAGGH